jgi:4-amino-4-deoxy-L-arabinose transferase-like glycosyltransferase
MSNTTENIREAPSRHSPQAPASRSRPKEWMLLGLIVALAVVVRAALMQGDPTPDPGSDGDEYDAYAWNLAQGRGYRGPSPAYSDREHLTSWRMPGPSLVFAAVYRVAGHRPAAAVAANILLSAATCVVLFYITRRFYSDPAGWLVAGAYALWPHAVPMSTTLGSEPLYVFLFMLFVLHSFTLAEHPTAKHIVLSGLLLGATLYARPHAFFVPFVAGWIVLVFWPNWRRIVAVSGLFAVVGLLFLPWVMRNYRLHERFVPFTTQGGEALLLGANRIVVTDPKFYGYAPGDARLIPEYEHEFDGLDEIQRSDRAMELYKQWMGENRDKWWFLIERKFRRFWSPFLAQPSLKNRLVMLLSWGPVLVLFVAPFLATLVRFLRTRDARLMVHAAILSTLLNSLVFSGLVRYRFPIEGLCLLFAVGACLFLWDKATARNSFRLVAARARQ